METDTSGFIVPAFPLTPALSLRERERINPVLSQTQPFWDFSKTAFTDSNLKFNLNTICCFPLPKGEGSRVRGNAAT